MTDTADRIKRLCVLLEEDDIWDYTEEAGAGHILRQIVTAIGTGAPDDTLRRRLDAIDDAMAAAGFGTVTRSARVFRPLPHARGHPVVHAWVCPARVPCARAETHAGRGGPPVCAATGQPLALVRLPT
ncbi:hypothetical protein FHS43_001899 [Streptosporangium becharense]|uniref:Uncharacterized protein n=1 Tax=Streptosporangium becharense TaxID=1816182 RepID=A0A7W9MEC8_9ACTN|nr:hypothetical protein [Streptosporangium becharense]MBB2910636.1 hypothetical protein [Streptosporangium becharense]MBB5817331.1 hypothetical protein [Streptosporangium becharense]